MTVKVLIVDDQEAFRAAAREVVASTNDFEVVGQVATGEDSIEAARRLQPDLVLMDVHLPGIDGVEASRRIRAERLETIVVLLSTYDPDEVSSRIRDLAAGVFISKASFGPDRLVAVWKEARLNGGMT